MIGIAHVKREVGTDKPRQTFLLDLSEVGDHPTSGGTGSRNESRLLTPAVSVNVICFGDRENPLFSFHSG